MPKTHWNACWLRSDLISDQGWKPTRYQLSSYCSPAAPYWVTLLNAFLPTPQLTALVSLQPLHAAVAVLLSPCSHHSLRCYWSSKCSSCNQLLKKYLSACPFCSGHMIRDAECTQALLHIFSCILQSLCICTYTCFFRRKAVHSTEPWVAMIFMLLPVYAQHQCTITAASLPLPSLSGFPDSLRPQPVHCISGYHYFTPFPGHFKLLLMFFASFL